MQIDVLIPIRDRAAQSRQCLTSLMRAGERVPNLDLRFLVCASGGHDAVTEMLKDVQGVCPTLSVWFEAESLNAAQARNRLLPQAQGEWLFFIDDDAFVDPDFFERFLAALRLFPHADVVGGPNLTPAGSSRFQTASGAVLSSRFAAWSSSARYRPCLPLTIGCDERVLISCNLFVRRSAMAGLKFPEFLTSNEENWLLQEIFEATTALVYAPQVSVWHDRRPSFETMSSQIYKYGIGRGQNLRQRPSSFTLPHVIPAAAVAFSLFAFALFPWLTGPMKTWLVLAAFYFVFWLIAAARLSARQSSLRLAMMSAALFPFVHLFYGFGVLRGLLDSRCHG
jgi:glycosyltransferase involved in cell wall biosynthesis